MYQTPKKESKSGKVSATLVPHTPGGGVDVEAYGKLLNPDGTPQVPEPVQDVLKERYGQVLGGKARNRQGTPQRTYHPSFYTPREQISGAPQDSDGEVDGCRGLVKGPEETPAAMAGMFKPVDTPVVHSVQEDGLSDSDSEPDRPVEEVTL